MTPLWSDQDKLLDLTPLLTVILWARGERGVSPAEYLAGGPAGVSWGMHGCAARALRSVGEHDGTVLLLSQLLILRAFSQAFLWLKPVSQVALTGRRARIQLVRPQLCRNEELPTTHTPKSGILEPLPSL